MSATRAEQVIAADARGTGGAIGFPTALATTVGLIMASPVILTVTSGFGMGGSAFVAAMAIAFVVMQAQAMSFAEAAAILPTTGSVYDYISCGLGRFCAVTGTLSAYLLVHVFAGTAETVLSGIMVLVNFDALHTVFERTGTSWLVGVGLVTIFAITNAFGVRVYSRVEVVLTLGMWLTLTLFGIAGLLHGPAVELEGWFGASRVGTSLPAVLSLVGMAMFMFVGSPDGELTNGEPLTARFA
jgi:amino acid transporter